MDKHVIGVEMKGVQEATFVCSCGWTDTVKLGRVRILLLIAIEHYRDYKVRTVMYDHAIGALAARLDVQFSTAERPQ